MEKEFIEGAISGLYFKALKDGFYFLLLGERNGAKICPGVSGLIPGILDQCGLCFKTQLRMQLFKP